jgi:splicing factor 3B subunit 4
MSGAVEQRNSAATCYVGGLEARVTEELLWELFTQVGPVASVFVPRDKVTEQHHNYGFVEFRQERDAEYACRVLNLVRLFGAPLRVNKSLADRRVSEIGANLFIGNLDDMVDEKLLHDTFATFGTIVGQPNIQRDAEAGKSRGFGFVNYDSFEAADLAIQCMHGQFLCNRQINVQYALKKESRTERHGSQAERLLAAELRAKQQQPPLQSAGQARAGAASAAATAATVGAGAAAAQVPQVRSPAIGVPPALPLAAAASAAPPHPAVPPRYPPQPQMAMPPPQPPHGFYGMMGMPAPQPHPGFYGMMMPVQQMQMMGMYHQMPMMAPPMMAPPPMMGGAPYMMPPPMLGPPPPLPKR